MDTVIVKTTQKNYWGTTTSTTAGDITFDKRGFAQITTQQFQILSHPRYEFMKLSKVDEKDVVDVGSDQDNEIKKIETDELNIQNNLNEQNHDFSYPTASQEVIQQSQDNDQELIDHINNLDKKADLQDIANELGLVENEWKSIRSKADLKAYIIDNIKS